MKTVTMYELLGLIKDGKAPKRIRYEDRTYTLYLDEKNNHYYQNDKCKFFILSISCFEELNEKIEILEDKPTQEEIKEYTNKLLKVLEPVKKQFSKLFDEITRIDNDLNLIDNNFNLENNSKEEKKIPEKIDYKIEYMSSSNGYLLQYCIDFAEKIDEIIDYLDYFKSKGE